MSDDLNLLPCPFCGGEAQWKVGGPGCAFIKCKSCPAETSDGSVPRIAKAWNTRAAGAEAKLSEQVEWVKSLADDLIAAEGREARIKAKLDQLLEVSKRAVRLSLEHPNSKLYSMEPMERAIDLAEMEDDDT